MGRRRFQVITVDGFQAWMKDARMLYASDERHGSHLLMWCLLDGSFEVSRDGATIYAGTNLQSAVDAYNEG